MTAMFPAPMDSHTMLRFLIGLVVLLLTARLLGSLARRLGLPAVVGELMAGVLLGPSLLAALLPGVAHALVPGDAATMHVIDGVAQLGVLLLVGVTGSHLQADTMRRHRRTALSVSLWGLAVPMSLGVGLGFLLPLPAGNEGAADRWIYALFLGIAMGVTALPVIAKTLADMDLLHRRIGQVILTAGTVDDTVCWLLLSILAAAATGAVTLGGMAFAVLAPIGFAAAAATLGRVLVRLIMRRAAAAEGAGASVSAAVLVVLSGATIAHALRLEPIFGAFVAGLLVGAPGAADHTKLAALRTMVMAVLAPIFLATAGLRMDLTALAEPKVALAGAVVLVVAIGGKFAGAYVGARLSGLRGREGLALGAGMNARGVVEVVVASTGLRLGVLDVAAYTTIVLLAIVTSLMAAPLLRLAMRGIPETGTEHAARIGDDVRPRSPAPVA
ncbi:cation:proton antiporter [Actinoplanes sp. NPDC049599]|uniref:cation:proton antiporter n=1 Tax=Actinoplanes sp. NPDC049599 TaxID=3363903 RepID=UPI0037B1A08D